MRELVGEIKKTKEKQRKNKGKTEERYMIKLIQNIDVYAPEHYFVRWTGKSACL